MARRLAAAWFTAVLAAMLLILAVPAAANAAYTASISGSTVRMNGNSASDSLFIDSAGGLSRHNRFTAGDPGFNGNFDMDTGAAGDQTVAAGMAFLVIDAAGGNDVVTLTSPYGGSTIEAGAGQDTVQSAGSPDTVNSVDGEADTVSCGGDTDIAFADTVDTVTNCEILTRTTLTPPAGPPPRLGVSLGKKKLKLKGHGARLALSCPAAVSGHCVGSAEIATKGKVAIEGRRVRLSLGEKGFDIAPGGSRQLKVKLDRVVDELLGSGKLRVKVSLFTSTDAGGIRSTAKATLKE